MLSLNPWTVSLIHCQFWYLLASFWLIFRAHGIKSFNFIYTLQAGTLPSAGKSS